MEQWGHVFSLGDVLRDATAIQAGRSLQERLEEEALQKRQDRQRQMQLQQMILEKGLSGIDPSQVAAFGDFDAAMRLQAAQAAQAEKSRSQGDAERSLQAGMYKEYLAKLAGIPADQRAVQGPQMLEGFKKLYTAQSGKPWTLEIPAENEALMIPPDPVAEAARKAGAVREAEAAAEQKYKAPDIPFTEQVARDAYKAAEVERAKNEAKAATPEAQLDIKKKQDEQQMAIFASQKALRTMEEAAELQNQTDRTGPIGGSDWILPANKALFGGGKLQELEQKYATMQFDALASLKAGGSGPGANPSNAEQEMVRATTGMMARDREPNLKVIMDQYNEELKRYAYRTGDKTISHFISVGARKDPVTKAWILPNGKRVFAD